MEPVVPYDCEVARSGSFCGNIVVAGIDGSGTVDRVPNNAEKCVVLRWMRHLLFCSDPRWRAAFVDVVE